MPATPQDQAPGHRQLAGKTAVVTGSAQGIGRAIALRLAAAGANVLVHARASRDAAAAVAEQVRAAAVESHVIFCDLADAATHPKLVDDAWKWHDRVDLWVNNAGADVLTGEAARWSFERKLDILWRVDVAATIALSRAAAARMKSAGGGTIINIGWDQAETGMAGDSGELFAATKGAVMAFTRSLARSHAPEVRVNCVAPGWIKTKWGEHAPDIGNRRPSASRSWVAGARRMTWPKRSSSWLRPRPRSSPAACCPSTAGCGKSSFTLSHPCASTSTS